MNAEIVGTNCTAALTFNDANDARQTLSSFRADPHVVTACVYTGEGKPFVSYARNGAGRADVPPQVERDGRTTWARTSRSSTRSTWTARRSARCSSARTCSSSQTDVPVGVILVGVLSAASAVAFVLASSLQRLISEPIQHPGPDRPACVSTERNYSVPTAPSARRRRAGPADRRLQRDARADPAARTGCQAHRDRLEEQVALPHRGAAAGQRPQLAGARTGPSRPTAPRASSWPT